MALDWLVVGGGLHGVHIAARLIGEGGVSAEQIRIVDPAPHLLARWRGLTATTGMTHLRSPSVHHLGLSPWALQHFAGRRKSRRKRGLFAAPYNRPSLQLFNAHCDRIVETYDLAGLHIRDRASSCGVGCDHVVVRVGSGDELEAQNVVLAIGMSEQPHWPAWAPREHPRVHHVFQSDFAGWPAHGGVGEVETVAVVGGGITAAQVTLRLVNEGHRVHFISRHGIREHQFDSSAGWLGPKLMGAFKREKDRDRRRVMFDEARFRGSLPPRRSSRDPPRGRSETGSLAAAGDR